MDSPALKGEHREHSGRRPKFVDRGQCAAEPTLSTDREDIADEPCLPTEWNTAFICSKNQVCQLRTLRYSQVCDQALFRMLTKCGNGAHLQPTRLRIRLNGLPGDKRRTRCGLGSSRAEAPLVDLTEEVIRYYIADLDEDGCVELHLLLLLLLLLHYYYYYYYCYYYYYYYYSTTTTVVYNWCIMAHYVRLGTVEGVIADTTRLCDN